MKLRSDSCINQAALNPLKTAVKHIVFAMNLIVRGRRGVK